MPIVLYRVDERLIHGQVVLGWGSRLHPDRYILVCDDLAGSAWEQDLYRLALEPGQEAEFVTVAAARDRLREWKDDSRRTIVLTRDLGAMRELARDGLLEGEEINVGGIHHGVDREQVLPYVHLGAEERRALEELAAEGVTVTARDLPDAHRVTLEKLLH